MIEVTVQDLALMFGFVGTGILLFAAVKVSRKNLESPSKYKLLTQLVGYLFLFDSFAYLLYDNFFGLNLTKVWPYFIFIIFGTFISLTLIKELGILGRVGIYITLPSENEMWFLVAPILAAVLVLFFNNDPLLLINIFIWHIIWSSIPKERKKERRGIIT